MKTRNRIIVCLAILGVIIFGIVQFAIIPKINQEKRQYTIEQQEPTTHDINSILKFKNKYMGNASNIINLFYTLPLNDIPKSFELFSDKLTVQVNFKDARENIDEKKLNKALIYNSTAAFALIDNLEAINYSFTDSKYQVLRSEVQKWYGEDLSKLLNKAEWKNKVQVKLEDSEYISNCAKLIFKKQ